MPSMMFLAIARPRPGARALGREVRVEHARQILGLHPDAAIADRRCGQRVPDREVSISMSGAPGHRVTASSWRARGDGMAGVGQDIHQRHPQALGIGDERRQRRIGVELHGACPDGAGARRLLGVGASGVDVGRRVVEADRPREVQHVVHDPIEPLDLFVHVGERLRVSRPGSRSRWPSVRSDALMIISGFRISCAITVDSRAERRQPLALRGLALKARDRIGERVERRRQQLRVFVFPGCRRGSARSSASNRRWRPSRAWRR